MPTKSKAQVKADEVADVVQEEAKTALARGADFPCVLEQATAAFRALNALAEAIRASVPGRKKVAAFSPATPPPGGWPEVAKPGEKVWRDSRTGEVVKIEPSETQEGGE